MKDFRRWLLVLLAVLSPLALAAGNDDAREAAAAKALLEKALAYYHDNGDKAFAAFSRQGQFIDGDRYVFVVDTQGVMLASGGPSAALIGRNVNDVIGPDLQQAFKQAVNIPEANGIQQTEYKWQNWQDGRLERKRVFYQRIGNRILAVGYYLPRASPQQAQALLDKAVAAIKSDQKQTVQDINNLKGGFLQDDLYVFVVDLNSHRYVAHGTNQRLVGVDFTTVRDPDGKPVGEPILALMAKQDSGEYDYRWRNPVTSHVEDKHVYVRKVGLVMVAVGYYSR